MRSFSRAWLVAIAVAAVAMGGAKAADFRLTRLDDRVVHLVDLAALATRADGTGQLTLYTAAREPFQGPNGKFALYGVWRYALDCARQQWRLELVTIYDAHFTVIDNLPASPPSWEPWKADHFEPPSTFAVFCARDPRSDTTLPRLTASGWQAAVTEGRKRLLATP